MKKRKTLKRRARKDRGEERIKDQSIVFKTLRSSAFSAFSCFNKEKNNPCKFEGIKLNKKEKIEQQINKTLDQFENAEQLTPNPYFFTRVQAHIEERQHKNNRFAAILRPALLTTLVAINLSTAFWYMSGDDQIAQADTHQELIELLGSDLELENNQSNILDFK